MPNSNRPDPDKIPDMSLDDSIHAPRPRETPDLSSSYQPEKESTKPSPLPRESVPTDWQEGDSVLAPWEPSFLYPGIIKEIKIDEARGDQALIDYDDGGEGWVFLYSLFALEFKEGQQVHARRNGSHLYSAGTIVEVGSDEVHVRYDEGVTEWSMITCLRVPCIENGPGATATKFAPFHSPDVAPSTGTGIPSWAIWIGISILLAVVRIGCREMGRN